MDNQDVSESIYNLEISICPEPHLEATQDLELLAQEIAEAAVEEERRSTASSSPSPIQFQDSETVRITSDKNDTVSSDREECEKAQETAQDNSTKHPEGRSQSPVDETTWEIVNAEEDTMALSDSKEKTQLSQAQNYSIARKFLAIHDLRQKLKDIGMICDDRSADCQTDHRADDQHPRQVEDLSGSCSESMVICDIPQEDVENNNNDVLHQLLLGEIPEGPKIPSWRGTIAGATVVIELEKLGGLLVASVRVNHVDLLSALNSLQQLAASAGLVSYADVDVQSLLARAA